MSLTLEAARGAACGRLLSGVAQLRIRLFRDWPYLYDGDPVYEAGYLRVYPQSSDSLVVALRDGDRLVGCATSLPLADDDPAFHAPFLRARIDVGGVYYLGELLLLPAYRGRGYGHALMDALHVHAQELGRFSHTALAVVERAADDPRRPPGHRDLDPFWIRRGYTRRPDLGMQLPWKEIGEAGETAKPMTFWMRPIA